MPINRMPAPATITVAVAPLLVAGASARAQDGPLTEVQAREIITPFYDAPPADAPEIVDRLITPVTTPDWQNCSGNAACETREASIALWSWLIAAVPGIAWEERDLIVADDRIIVRGELSGTPVMPFLGVEPTGRGFSVMTIDVHGLRDGRIARTHHLENLADAIRQLTDAT